MLRQIREDAPSLDLESRIDPRTGALVLRYAPTWIGVQEYLQEDGSISRELHRPEQVWSDGFLATVRRLTQTLDHPSAVQGDRRVPGWVNVDPDFPAPPGYATVTPAQVGIGLTGDVVEPRPAPNMKGVDLPTLLCTITDQRVIDLIVKGGMRESSLGYDTFVDRTPGVWIAPDGTEHPYDAEHVLDPNDPRIAKAIADGKMTAAQAATLGANHFAVLFRGRGKAQSALRLDAATPLAWDYVERQRFTFGVGENGAGVFASAYYPDAGDPILVVPGLDAAGDLAEILASDRIWALNPRDDGAIPLRTDLEEPRRFYFERREDVNGKSGTGRVADGIRWGDGRITIRWRTECASTTDFDCLEDFECIHGHEGRGVAIWIDPAPALSAPSIEVNVEVETEIGDGCRKPPPYEDALPGEDPFATLEPGHPAAVAPIVPYDDPPVAGFVGYSEGVDANGDPWVAFWTVEGVGLLWADTPAGLKNPPMRVHREDVNRIGDVSNTAPTKVRAIAVPDRLRRSDAMASFEIPDDPELRAVLEALLMGAAEAVRMAEAAQADAEAGKVAAEGAQAEAETQLESIGEEMKMLQEDAREGRALRLRAAQDCAKRLGLTPTGDTAEEVQAEIVAAKVPSALDGLTVDSADYQTAVRAAFRAVDAYQPSAPAKMLPGPARPLVADAEDKIPSTPRASSLRARLGKVK